MRSFGVRSRRPSPLEAWRQGKDAVSPAAVVLFLQPAEPLAELRRVEGRQRHEDGVLPVVAVIAGPYAHADEAILLVKGQGCLVGAPHLQRHYVLAVLDRHVQAGDEEHLAYAAPSMGLPHGQGDDVRLAQHGSCASRSRSVLQVAGALLAEELVRFDSSGAQQWSVTTFANDSSYSVGVTGDDTVFVSGQKRSTADGSLIFSEGGKYWSDADPMTHDLRIITTPSTHVGRRHAGLDNWTTSLAGFSSIADLNVSDGQKAIVVGNDANPRSRIESYLADGTYEWGEQSSGTGTAHLFGSVDSIGQDIWVAQRNFIGGDDIAPLVHRYSEDGTSHTSWTAPFPSSRPLVQIAVDHVTRIYLAYIGDQGATPSILTQLSSGGDGIWSVNLRGNSGVNIRVFHPERLY